jgi:hypothetical protein
MSFQAIPLEHVLSQLPAILIVSSSIAVDQCLRADLIEERFRCQVWLWLTVLLSLHSHANEEDDGDDLIFESWIHLVIVSNLASIVWLAAMGPLQRMSKRNIGTWWLPFAAWNAMISSSCLFSDFTRQPRALFSTEVYLASMAALWVVQWRRKRKERINKELRRITISRHPSFFNSNENGGIDPSQWCTWKASTTLRWISQVFLWEEDDDTVVIQQLASHRIHGALLDTLTISQLLALQVPYGPACRLAHAIETELLRPHPKPREAQTVVTEREPPLQSDFLSSYDQEYNNEYSNDQKTSFRMQPMQPINSDSVNHSTNQYRTEKPSIRPEEEERMGAIMKERFGLELPQFNVDKSSDLPPKESISHPLMEDRKPPTPYFTKTAPPFPAPVAAATASKDMSSYQAVAEPQKSAEGMPPGLLDQMPSHIKDIAKRRPDLVRQLLQNQSLEQQQQPLLSSLTEEGEQEAEDADDDETTQLIRRKSRPTQYKSTGL